MAEKTAKKEFLIVALPDTVETGVNLRLLGVESTQASAEKVLESLGAATLGRVAIVERKSVFIRRTAVESVEVDESVQR